MEKTVLTRFLALCVCALAAAAFSGCSTYPVDTGNRDLCELESVWQYLKTYSIWQDRVPSESSALMSFQTPEALLSSVRDTFHTVNYTTYDSAHLPQGGRLAEAAAGAADSTVYWYRLTAATALLQITEFKKDTTYPGFKNALPSLSQYQNIIVDLRGNGGGDINTVDSILEHFLPAGTPYISANYRKYDEAARSAATLAWEDWTTKIERTPTLSRMRISVLINGGSASASEILAAGLKDGRKAAGSDTVALVGEKTFGKGMGQIIISRAHLGKRDVKITYLLLKGLSARTGDYHRKGITPDITATLPDAQLLQALRTLEPLAVLPKALAVHTLLKSAATGAYVRVTANPAFEE